MPDFKGDENVVWFDFVSGGKVMTMLVRISGGNMHILIHDL